MTGDIPNQPQPLIVDNLPCSSWKSKLVGWTVAGVIGAFIGFVYGTEWQHVSSLEVPDYKLPGLYLDKEVFERAAAEAEAEDRTLDAIHFRSNVNVITHQIAKSESAD